MNALSADAATAEGQRPRIVAGSGRSGTTWVLDALAEANGLRTIFEPLRPGLVPGASVFAHRFVLPEEAAPELKDFFAPVFRGRVASLWTDYRVNVEHLRADVRRLPRIDSARRVARKTRKLLLNYLRYRRRWTMPQLLVKLVRGNLLLGWLHRNFEARIVLIVRHPGAVVESKLRVNLKHWEPYSVLARYRDDPVLRAQAGPRIGALLEGELSLPEAQTLLWCIENELAVREAGRSPYLVVHYEDLVTQPAVEWPRVATALDLPVIPNAELRRKPSQQTRRDLATTRFDQSHLSRWATGLAPDTIDEMAGILEAVGVTSYSMDTPLPKRRAQGIPG